jgi:hypothetical protein
MFGIAKYPKRENKIGREHGRFTKLEECMQELEWNLSQHAIIFCKGRKRKSWQGAIKLTHLAPKLVLIFLTKSRVHILGNYFLRKQRAFNHVLSTQTPCLAASILLGLSKSYGNVRQCQSQDGT